MNCGNAAVREAAFGRFDERLQPDVLMKGNIRFDEQYHKQEKN